MSVTTGYELEYGPRERPIGPVGRQILFNADEHSSEAVSAMVIIASGSAGLFTVYNMPDGKTISTLMVSIGTFGGPRVPSACAPLRVGHLPVDQYSIKPTILGAASWVLTSDNPQMIITLPGSYRFALEDTDMLLDTGLFMEMLPLRLDQLPVLNALVIR